jgi:hypothetical protein
MNDVYQFRFYHPIKKPARVEALLLLEKLMGLGSRVFGFEKNGCLTRYVPPEFLTGKNLDLASRSVGQKQVYFKDNRELPNPSDLVAEDGQTWVEFHTLTAAEKRLDYTLAVGETADKEIARLSVEGPGFKEETDALTLLSLAETVISCLMVWFAWADHGEVLDSFSPFLSLEKIRALAWADFFGQEFLELVGREFILKAPGYDTNVSEKGVMFLLSPNPRERPSPILLAKISDYFKTNLVSPGLTSGFAPR